jgi:hypothetical protein
MNHRAQSLDPSASRSSSSMPPPLSPPDPCSIHWTLRGCFRSCALLHLSYSDAFVHHLDRSPYSWNDVPDQTHPFHPVLCLDSSSSSSSSSPFYLVVLPIRAFSLFPGHILGTRGQVIQAVRDQCEFPRGSCHFQGAPASCEGRWINLKATGNAYQIDSLVSATLFLMSIARSTMTSEERVKQLRAHVADFQSTRAGVGGAHTTSSPFNRHLLLHLLSRPQLTSVIQAALPRPLLHPRLLTRHHNSCVWLRWIQDAAPAETGTVPTLICPTSICSVSCVTLALPPAETCPGTLSGFSPSLLVLVHPPPLPLLVTSSPSPSHAILTSSLTSSVPVAERSKRSPA